MGKKVLNPFTNRLVDIGETEETEEERKARLEAMFPPSKLKRIMTKELRRYAEKQSTKWERWKEAMSK